MFLKIDCDIFIDTFERTNITFFKNYNIDCKIAFIWSMWGNTGEKKEDIKTRKD